MGRLLASIFDGWRKAAEGWLELHYFPKDKEGEVWIRPGVSHGFAYPLYPAIFLTFPCFFYFLLHFLVFFLIFSYLGPMGSHGAPSRKKLRKNRKNKQKIIENKKKKKVGTLCPHPLCGKTDSLQHAMQCMFMDTKIGNLNEEIGMEMRMARYLQRLNKERTVRYQAPIF